MPFGKLALSGVAAGFVNENDYKKISTGTLFAKQEFEQNCLYWLVSKQCSSDSSKYESCSEDEKISVSEEEEMQTENELKSASETPERSCTDDTSADEEKEMKKSDS